MEVTRGLGLSSVQPEGRMTEDLPTGCSEMLGAWELSLLGACTTASILSSWEGEAV